MTARSPRVCSIIEARMTSTRLPGKVLMDLGGKPVLEVLIDRLGRVERLDGVIVATTVNAADDPIVALAERLGVGYFRGSEDNVLERVLLAAKAHDVDVIVETTGDNPLLDPVVVERCIGEFLFRGCDYLANNLAATYPDGIDVQTFWTRVLEEGAALADTPEEREHVTACIKRRPERFSIVNLEAPPEHVGPEIVITLDTEEDLQVIRAVVERLGTDNPAFGVEDIIRLFLSDPALGAINGSVPRKYDR